VKALVELPIYGDARESEYLYAATVHWKPIANGYSSYEPESYLRLVNLIPRLPHADGFDLLRKMGITHIVLHTDKTIDWRAVERWERRFGPGPRQRLEKVYEEAGISVYRLIDRP
jgi:hypothetical protein